MKIRSIKFYFGEAFDNLIKNKLMAFASMITVSSCILITIVSFCVAKNINFALEQLNNSIGLSIIVSDNLAPDKINHLYEKILAIPYVSEVKFISSEEALEQLSHTLEDSSQMLDGLKNDNPLPCSFDITLKDNNFYEQAIKEFEKLKSAGVYKIRNALDETKILLKLSKIVRIISASIVLTLALISIIIIMNTIKLAVNGRKDEISIMKYIGATNWFIRWPFIIEGMIIGFIGTAIPVIICWPFYDKAIDVINESLPYVSEVIEFKSGLQIFLELIPIVFTMGVIMGMIGSFSSIRKYLDV